MRRARALFASVVLALLPSCGPPPEASTPEAGGEPKGAEASAPEAKATPGAAPSASPGASGAPETGKPGGNADAHVSESMSLARDLVAAYGNRIGYSATKRSFAFSTEHRSGMGLMGSSLDIHFVGDDGRPRDTMSICQTGCKEEFSEFAKELLPKLASRLEQDGYVSLQSIYWPWRRDELEVNRLSMKLKYTNGRLEALREGKPAARLTLLGERSLYAERLLAVFVIPDTKLLATLAPPRADETGVAQDFYFSLWKLP